MDEIVEEIMRIHRSLPARPGIDEVEAAEALISNVEREDQARLEAIAKQKKGPNVPEELFMVLQEMQKNMVHLQSKQQKREALKLLDLENAHRVSDDVIQRASNCVSSNPSSNSRSRKPNKVYDEATSTSASISTSTSTSASSSSASLLKKEPAKGSELFTRDDSYVSKAKSTFYPDGYGIRPAIVDSSLKPITTLGTIKKLSFNTIFHVFKFQLHFNYCDCGKWQGNAVDTVAIVVVN